MCVPYLFRLSENPFTVFNDNLYVPGEFTGKKTHTYIDDLREGDVYDYLDNLGHYKELSGVHLENAPYSISDTPMSKIKSVLEFIEEKQFLWGSGHT